MSFFRAEIPPGVAVEQSDRDRLETQRARLELLLTEADAREFPALSREYRAVLADLRNLPTAGAATVRDQLRERRARRSEAADTARSSGA